ncbi:Uncharacterized membrane protein [Filimonas lacunae]|uniref:Uncharacterized membrane protein n=1 Tax=Filimonas lacunae TaxID=477680 RepID=A0A173MIY6_9BACT|nr:DoxX family protein [Filimonas lacunae]BAV07603.1 hypothetical protein FLA_3629 [Filimonas lacunae]SIT29816.1 Uncharacterized membrane protein [Filimonas lacunae]
MRKILLYTQAVFYALAGINHFTNPEMYLAIMPPWLPWHLTLVNISGALEIITGLLLLPIRTRKWAARAIILLLIAIFPANIQMLINFIREHNPYIVLAIIRLPLQLLLIRWAWIFQNDHPDNMPGTPVTKSY